MTCCAIRGAIAVMGNDSPEYGTLHELPPEARSLVGWYCSLSCFTDINSHFRRDMHPTMIKALALSVEQGSPKREELMRALVLLAEKGNPDVIAAMAARLDGRLPPPAPAPSRPAQAVWRRPAGGC